MTIKRIDELDEFYIYVHVNALRAAQNALAGRSLPTSGLNHRLVKHKRNKGLGSAYSSHNARKKLLTACQHWNHDITCLSDWPIYRCHNQLRPSVKLSKLVMWPVQPNMFGWWQNSSRSVYSASQGKTGVYTLPHKITVTCEIIFFVCVAWRKIAAVWQCLAEGKTAPGVVILPYEAK